MKPGETTLKHDIFWKITTYVFYAVVPLVIIKVFNVVSKGTFRSNKRLDGKVIIVTGGNRGIGKYTALDFAKRGSRVILACRDLVKANETKDEIIEISGNKNVVVRYLDLSSFASIRNFAKDVISTENRLDVLVNNAGLIETANKKTEDGLEFGLQVNHYGPFLLTNLLMDLLKKSAPSRIVNVSSLLHLIGQLDFDNMNREKDMHYWMIYNNSKLYNLIGSNEIARRLEGSGVTSNTLHPGIIKTEIFNSLTFILRFGINTTFDVFGKTEEEGAQTTIYLAVSDDVKNVSGKHFQDCKETIFSRPIANNRKIGKKFFEKCCDMVGLKPEERFI